MYAYIYMIEEEEEVLFKIPKGYEAREDTNIYI